MTAKDAGDNSATQPTSLCSEFTKNRTTYAVDIPLFVTNSARSSARSLPAKSSRLPRTNTVAPTKFEHYEQSALFQWANLALRACRDAQDAIRVVRWYLTEEQSPKEMKFEILTMPDTDKALLEKTKW